MSKINSIRIINLSYNYNGIRVDDEILHLGGDSTMLSLRNGGGKSVLVQMLMAPFVNRRYRNINDRIFSSYFNSNKPSFILIEWNLDGNASYVLTGMMVRKNQDLESNNELEIFQFIHEYKEANQYDINNIPFVSDEDGKKILRSFSSCRTLLESIKQDRNYNFFLYDMNNSNSSRSYYQKLEEYQIYYKEWQSIIRKINQQESGLSSLFINAKDESGLVEEWFLPAIEDKLNKEKNRINEFRDIIGSYIKQYKDNKSKIDQKGTILLFKEQTKTALGLAESLSLEINNKKSMENHIANLIMELKNLKEILESERIDLTEKIANANESVKRIEYESLSYETHVLQDEKNKLENECIIVKKLIEDKDISKLEITKKINIQECAKIYKKYKELSREVQEHENRLEIKKEQNKDMVPEREALGFTLKCYYEQKKLQLENQINIIEKKITQNKEEIQKLKNTKSILEKEKEAEIKEEAKLEQLIKTYDELELKFNKKYSESLRRNMLQEYEEESLGLRLKKLSQNIDNKEVEITKLKATKEENEEKINSINKMLQEKESQKSIIQSEIKAINKEIKGLDEETNTRKVILRYIGLKEEDIFKREVILEGIQRKIDEISEKIKGLESQFSSNEKDYSRLKSGQVLELPKDLEDALDLEGYHFVYGMDWLKNNNKTAEENKEIVDNNPFIPYSIIMSEKEINSLKSSNLNIYTSFPIPIIKRESIDSKINHDQGLIPNDIVNFYVLFNNNLLDEAELQLMLDSIQNNMDKIREILDIRNNELKDYNKKYYLIENQKVNESNYKNLKEDLLKKESQLQTNEEERKNLRDDEYELSNLQNKIQNRIESSRKEVAFYIGKKDNLEELSNQYKKDQEYRRNKTSVKNNLLKLSDDLSKIQNDIQVLEENNKNAENSRTSYNIKLNDAIKKYNQYSIYDEAPLVDKDIEDIEARFKALTNEISSEISEIEDALEKSRYHFKEYEEDLTETASKFKLKQEEYIDVIYDGFVVKNLEQDQSKILDELNELDNKNNSLKTKIAVKESNILTKYESLSNIGYEKPIPRNEIIVTDFKDCKEKKQYELEMLNLHLGKIDEKLNNVKANVSSLSEYSELELTEEIHIGEEIKFLIGEELDKYRGSLIRDYKNINSTINNETNKLSDEIEKVSRNDAFTEDFFRRPLDTLSKLVYDPDEFIEQLLTTIKAYDDLIDKLEVDIAIVGKEEERVIEILLEYIGDVHKNMGKIDKNSTIKIRDKSVKMLKINLPDWDNEVNNYRIKLKEMIENLTQIGIARLEDNENIEELISTSINSKNLYNTVVGISNIEIKLYKIEAEREVSIKWTDVSKNSGGEGFLSAFVILSSLLSFTRRDESDIFAEREESKVLIMDNPFAQIYSSHLLKPLMDIAKKSNTQLICFTGLGGEDIYNCFDNIYVLNTIPSKLRKGMEYLKPDHIKGEDYEAIIPSRIKTEDVERLNFLF